MYNMKAFFEKKNKNIKQYFFEENVRKDCH